MNRKLITLVCVASAALNGCAVSKQTFGPDGRIASSINCSGWAMGWDACYKKAGDLCRERGYDVLAANGETGSVVTANPGSVFGGSVISRVLLISCKGEPAKQ